MSISPAIVLRLRLGAIDWQGIPLCGGPCCHPNRGSNMPCGNGRHHPNAPQWTTSPSCERCWRASGLLRPILLVARNTSACILDDHPGDIAEHVVALQEASDGPVAKVETGVDDACCASNRQGVRQVGVDIVKDAGSTLSVSPYRPFSCFALPRLQRPTAMPRRSSFSSDFTSTALFPFDQALQAFDFSVNVKD